MKFQSDRFEVAVTGHGPGWVAVAGERIAHSLVLHSDGTRAAWPCERFEMLTAAHFEPLAQTRPEVVLFGSGARLRFAKPTWLRPLIDANIGVECMDTAAACRTFNILASEGRRVVAAVLIEPLA
ncbi:MAG: Mth938-like domain-containing protein [Burkholderiaceae bacterium]|jgi:uncharacterized protein|nr:Mth938-like domain-containing protein [Burkholderiaceae bacterium]